ncbi:MAG TPA: type II secretion system F family protein, partial [Roseimicrobium sp.]|nr:type II secretion system F family protein [Roseimicrobium sp.]
HRPHLAAVLQCILAGDTFTEAVRKQGTWIPQFDLALIEAGEQSGRLDVCLKLLAEYYRQRAQMVRGMIGEALYPVFVLHFAAVLFPTSLLLNLVLKGDVFPFLLQKGLFFGTFYGIIIGITLMSQGSRGEQWRTLIENALHHIPIIGRARRALALARLASALESLINAGVGIIEAWRLAGAASGSPALRRRTEAWVVLMEGGVPPSELISNATEFPEMFRNLYCSGEISGKLDDTLSRLFLHYHEEGTRLARLVAQWLPKILYLGVALYVAFQVVGFYSNYFNEINKAIGE